MNKNEELMLLLGDYYNVNQAILFSKENEYDALDLKDLVSNITSDVVREVDSNEGEYNGMVIMHLDNVLLFSLNTKKGKMLAGFSHDDKAGVSKFLEMILESLSNEIQSFMLELDYEDEDEYLDEEDYYYDDENDDDDEGSDDFNTVLESLLKELDEDDKSSQEYKEDTLKAILKILSE